MTIDVFGRALYDYLLGNTDSSLTLHNSYGEPEKMPVAVFFREFEELSALERKAVNACRGSVLDIGAGAGAITLIIQQKLNVTALEKSHDACQIAKQLGVKRVINQDIWEYHGEQYDTLFMLMNGIGIVRQVKKIAPFLEHLRTLLTSGGQIILDSSDLTYLYPAFRSNPELGEIGYQYEYEGQKGDWFHWLYVDEKTLEKTAEQIGFKVDIIFRRNDGQYLAVLT